MCHLIQQPEQNAKCSSCLTYIIRPASLTLLCDQAAVLSITPDSKQHSTTEDTMTCGKANPDTVTVTGRTDSYK